MSDYDYGKAEPGARFDGRALAERIDGEVRWVTDEMTGRMRDDDYDLYRSSIQPGETVEPKGGKLKTKRYRDELGRECREARERISRACKRAGDAARREMTEAPDPAALSYCQAMASRASVSVEEMAAALERYGGNWTCYQVLSDSIRDRRERGERDFYRLDPRSTLEGWQEMTGNMEREAGTFLTDYIARQGFGDDRTLDRRLDQLTMSLGYMASNRGERPFGNGSSPAWSVFDRMGR